MDRLKQSADGLFSKFKNGLAKTRASFVSNMKRAFTFWKKIDESFWEELEDIMLTSDIGIPATERILTSMRKIAKEQHIIEPSELLEHLQNELIQLMSGHDSSLVESKEPPTVVLFVGVNGTGKTTTVAKLAAKLKSQGKTVLLAAADTFRAAAIDQLQLWADRVGVDLIRTKEGGDPAAVCYDAVSSAKARRCDYLLIDTAGRLHSKSNLMEELKKMKRVISRELPGAPHETLIVIDAVTGQNGLIQAKTFSQVSELTGIVLTKLDGTAKGGIAISICEEMDVPVKFVCFGEKSEDMTTFDPEIYVRSLFE